MATNPEKPEGVILPPTIGETFVSFVYTCIFGLSAIVPWMKLKDIIPTLITVLSGNEYAYRAAYIFTMLVLGIVWVVFFFLLWHRLEQNFDYKRGLFRTLKWTGIALGIYLLAVGGQALMNIYLIGI